MNEIKELFKKVKKLPKIRAPWCPYIRKYEYEMKQCGRAYVVWKDKRGIIHIDDALRCGNACPCALEDTDGCPLGKVIFMYHSYSISIENIENELNKRLKLMKKGGGK